MRVVNLIRSITARRDFGSAIFLGVILLISGWLIGMACTAWVPLNTMNRFHLQTGSFPAWSLQQLIPAMYNLENEFEFRPDGPVPESVAGYLRTRQLNHFPLRVVTFFDYRYGMFHSGVSGELIIRSRYRDQQLTTRWRVDAFPDRLELDFRSSR